MVSQRDDIAVFEQVLQRNLRRTVTARRVTIAVLVALFALLAFGVFCYIATEPDPTALFSMSSMSWYMRRSVIGTIVVLSTLSSLYLFGIIPTGLNARKAYLSEVNVSIAPLGLAFAAGSKPNVYRIHRAS